MKEYPQIKTIEANTLMKGMAYMTAPVEFAHPDGQPLKLMLLCPWIGEADPDQDKRFPLIVFIQGSAFCTPDQYRKIPQLSMFAQAGYVVATISHRSCLDGNPFPAFLEDIKTAVRFLRAHADEYHIDPDRVAAWGSSSGGCGALLLGMTADDPEYKTDEYMEYSDGVSAVVDCFGPARAEQSIESYLAGEDIPYKECIAALLGPRTSENIKRCSDISPYVLLEKGRSCPPVLILHGDADITVPYSQSEDFYKSLIDHGVDAGMVRVCGAPHERSFWSCEVLAEIKAFLDSHI